MINALYEVNLLNISG